VRNSQGRFIVAGRGSIARLQSNGSIDEAFVPPGISLGDSKIGCARQGKIIWAGVDSAGQVTIVRLERNGDRDRDFVATLGIPSTLGSPKIEAIAVQSDGKVLIAGELPDRWWTRKKLMRLNRDGSIDDDFSAEIPNSKTLRIAIDEADRILILSSSSSKRDSPLLRLLPDGRPDYLFQRHSHLVGYVYALVLDGDSIYFGGAFLKQVENATGKKTVLPGLVKIQGGDPPADVPLILESSPDTEVAFGYGVNLTVDAQGFPQELAYRWFKNGELIPGNSSPDLALENVSFEDAGDYEVEVSNTAGSVRATTRLRVRGLRPGDIDTTFDPGSGFGGGIPYSIERLPNGQFMAYGTFTHFRGVRRPGLVRINLDGMIDESFDADLDEGLLARIRNVEEDGSVLTYIGSYRNDIVRFHPDGSAFKFPSLKGFEIRSLVYQAIVRPDGTLLTLAGHTTDHPDPKGLSIIGINPDGTQNSFGPVYFGSTSLVSICQIILLPDGKILVHGRWNSVNGTEHDGGIVRLHPSGRLDATILTKGAVVGMSGIIGIQPNGNMITTEYNQKRSELIYRRRHSDGTIDPTFDLSNNAQLPDALKVQDVFDDGKLLATLTRTEDGGRETVILSAEGTVERRYPWPSFHWRFGHFPDRSYLVASSLDGFDGLPYPQFARRRGMGDDPVFIADAAVESALREIIGKPGGALTAGDLMALRILDLSNRGISDLRGLEGALDLEALIIAETT
jgi:uncharacterized delta-60 repeat protein